MDKADADDVNGGGRTTVRPFLCQEIFMDKIMDKKSCICITDDSNCGQNYGQTTLQKTFVMDKIGT